MLDPSNATTSTLASKGRLKGEYLMKISGRHFSSAILSLLLLVVLTLSACGSNTDTATGSTNKNAPVTINLGYFPNVTHAVAVVGVAQGTFKKALGANVTVNTK